MGWKVEDEIERYILNPRVAKETDGLACLGSGVNAVHPGQHALVEALSAEGDAIHSGVAPGIGCLPCYVVGICLDRQLGALIYAGPFANDRQQPCDASSSETGRRSAAEVDGVERPR